MPFDAYISQHPSDTTAHKQTFQPLKLLMLVHIYLKFTTLDPKMPSKIRNKHFWQWTCAQSSQHCHCAVTTISEMILDSNFDIFINI